MVCIDHFTKSSKIGPLVVVCECTANECIKLFLRLVNLEGVNWHNLAEAFFESFYLQSY